MRPSPRAVKDALHPHLDPLFSLPDRWRMQRALVSLPDGATVAGVTVPYYAQFASEELIHAYIHAGYDGAQDPNWASFGADNPVEYAFWAPRVCALACLKMAIEAFRPDHRPTLWQLVKEGLALNGYTVRDEHGNWIDQGWTYPALVGLAQRYGLAAEGRGYAAVTRVCDYVKRGWLVMASVTPEIGERTPRSGRYGGHFVLVYGFDWRSGAPAAFHLHNPSGRYPELQANARLPARRFAASYAHRLIALAPLGAAS